MATAKSKGRSSGTKSRSASSARSGSKSGAKSRAASSARSSKAGGGTRSTARSSSKTNPNARAGSRPGAPRARSRGSTAARSRSQAGSLTTTDHDQIRQWAEARGGTPSCVMGTGGKGDTGMLRIDFPGFTGEGSLQPISWDEFFEKFDEQGLAMVYQEKTKDGTSSNFNKLVSRRTAKAKGGSRGKSR